MGAGAAKGPCEQARDSRRRGDTHRDGAPLRSHARRAVESLPRPLRHQSAFSLRNVRSIEIPPFGPEPAPTRFQILSLSGGGYRGLYSAAVLAALEGAGPAMYERFDLFAGTSIGG